MTENQAPSTATGASTPITAPPPKRPTDLRSALVGAGIVILLLLGFAAGRWLHSGSAPAAASAAASPAISTAATSTTANSTSAAAPVTAPAPADAAAAPAPTTQSASTSPVQAAPGSVVGNWSGNFQWHGKPLGQMHWQFNADGTMLGTSGTATTAQQLWQWRQRGDEVEFAGSGNTYYGTIRGDSMSGTMRVLFTNGNLQNTGIFDATRSQ